MVLKKDKKGIVSIVDAMIFVALVAIVSTCLFSVFASEIQNEPMAKTVCDDLTSVRLKASDLLDTDDSDVYDISDLIASGMNSDSTEKIKSYISKTLDGLIPKMYGYELNVSFERNEMTFSRNTGNEMTSKYLMSVEVANGMNVQYDLTIY